MKFAVVEGERREAAPGLSAECQACGAAMIARCGRVRVWHWAHRTIRRCDNWWEPETEWHRAWKNHFPEDWQEKMHQSQDGQKHIADVKTDRGVVLEFQHSSLCGDERESRETFYQKMVWVVDGLRRRRDRSRFFASLPSASIVTFKPLTCSLRSNEGALLRDWADSRWPVFFDFGEPVLWRLDPRSPNGVAHLSPVLKTSFLDKYRKGSVLKGIHLPELLLAARYLTGGLGDFERYWARKERTRRRF